MAPIRLLLSGISLFVCVNSFTQTFSNSVAEAYNTWNGPLTKTVSVTGLTNPLSSPSNVLRQVNIDFGDGTNTGNMSSFVITLTSPGTTTITIIASGGFPNCLIKRANVKYRDHSVLRFPGDYGCSKEPYNIGYYRTNTANDFSVFNGENPNGTWTITITEGTSSEISFNSIDLIFGAAFTYNDISASAANDPCSGAQCMETGKIIIGNNNGYANPGPATDPPITLDGCSWNGAKHNSAWFIFQASATSAKFTISGIDNLQEIIAFTISGSCSTPTYTLLTGGCPTDAVNDTYTSPQYGGAGCSGNMQLNMSSLTVGSTYYVMVDGSSGNISDFYIDMESGAAGCGWLPVELLSFDAFRDGSAMRVRCDWITASEINNDYFAVQRSQDGINFSQIGTMQGAGNSSTIQYYTYYDNEPFYGLSFYRLKQVDYDGAFSFSNIEPVYIGKLEIINIYPSPGYGDITVDIATEQDTEATTEVFNVIGQKTISQSDFLNKGRTQIKIRTGNLASGGYVFKVTLPTREYTQKVFVR